MHFMAQVVGHRFAHSRRLAVEHGREALDHRTGNGVVYLGQHHEAGSSLVHCADRGALPSPLIRSPSQWPGMRWSSISGGGMWMLCISLIWPWRSTPNCAACALGCDGAGRQSIRASAPLAGADRSRCRSSHARTFFQNRRAT